MSLPSANYMQVGIDSFAAAHDDADLSVSPSERLRRLVEQIERADQSRLDVFGVWEHHRREFLDSAPSVILGAAAARTQRICLISALTVLCRRLSTGVSRIRNPGSSVARPCGDGCRRGSFIEAFPLFGLRLEDYDSLFEEKLYLLLKIRDNEHVHWSGEYRPTLNGQSLPEALTGALCRWALVGLQNHLSVPVCLDYP
jgi:alkanesulfonate monooxygenase SsuD/methylene tetrahydromethanopterin reductase-like flavin-dependent oxidoreductase (luciferase family)